MLRTATALEQFGDVLHAFVRHNERGTHGFVSFVSEQTAEQALAVGHAFIQTEEGPVRISLRRREDNR